LPYSVSENKLFQTDVWRAMRKANLEVELARQLESVLLALQASCKKSDTPFKSFIEKFQTRFEGQFIPLMKLLDDEVGISFSNESGYEMPLLEDIDFSGSSRENNEAGKEALEQNLLKAWKNSYETIIQLKTDELLSGYDSEILWQQMPASFAVNVSAYRDDSGQLIIHYHNCHGPSGANWLGRFCHLNGELLEQVRDYLAAEASLSPDVIFAEIAHMPDGRPGNVVSRPALRDYEIVFMADSCLPEEQQINMQDLYVFLEHGQVKLWSSKLNKQIIPRLTCAHNFSARSLGVYRFLCMLQHQQAQLPYFKMPTALQQLECIPRVQLDNVILQEAQWRVERKMFEALVVDNRWCVEAWHALEKRYKLTRYVCYATGDNVLTIDLYNPAMLEMLLDETNSQHYFMLKECLQMQYQSMVMSDEGEFSHEIIVPMLNTRSVPFVTVNPQPEKQLDISIQRYYAPGSECLSLKIYAEHSIAELVLVQTLGPFLQAYKQQGLLKKWFFIRYGDPDWHLRLRVFGEPAVLCGTILPQLQQKLSPLLYSQRINKIEACTYQREVERYGGNSAIELAEQVFQTDSVFVLESLSLVRRYDESVRWRMALLGVNDILTAFEYDSMQKLKLISELRHSFGQEFYEDTQLRNQLGKKYRESQAQIKADFQISTVQTNEPLSQSMAIARTKFLFQLQPIAQKILVLHRQGQLNCSIDTLLHSLLHMFNNRIFKARGREQEFVVYDFLRRFYLSWQAQHTVEEVQQTTSRYQ
jgi:thiopeptide-type bacteriocin biosynthesis protein